MRRAFRIAGPVLGVLLAACSVLNRPNEPQRPEPRQCDAGLCGDAAADPCDGCDPLATCDVLDAGARCTCPTAYLDSNGDGTRCEERRECSVNLDCGDHGVCRMVDGMPACTCRGGYRREDGRCNDIDECEEGSHDCDDHARCVDEPGGFTCACADGFTDPDGDGRSCRDIDECEEGGARCGENALCVNSEGGYGCTCARGYEGSPRTGCEDTDECARGLLECALPATCSDLPGSARCTCPGYYSDVNGDGSECADDRLVASIALDVTPSFVYIATPYATTDSPLAVVVAGYHREAVTAFCDREIAGAEDANANLYIAGLDGNHHCRWVRAFGSAGQDLIRDVVMGRDGGPAVLAELDGPVTLDGVDLPGPSCMLLKFDHKGTLEWPFRLSGCTQPHDSSRPLTRSSVPDLLDVDAAGNFYLLQPTFQPDSMELSAAVYKVSPSGEPLWVEAFRPEAGNTSVIAETLAAAPDGGVYLSGVSGGDFALPGGLTTPGGPAGFLVALDREGKRRWLHLFNDGYSPVVDLAAHADGVHVLTTTARWTPTLVSLQALDLEGEEVWRTELGEGQIRPLELEGDRTGRLIAVGEIADPAFIGGAFATDTVQLFLTCIDPDGSIAWSHIYGEEQGVPTHPWLYLADLAFGPNDLLYVVTEGLYLDHPGFEVSSLTALRP